MKSKRTRPTTAQLRPAWQENVGVYTHCPAIHWKASQKKDELNLRSPRSEDALTWQVFRSLEAAGLLDRLVEDLLGISDQYRAYYWQRPWHQYVIDPTIDKVLGEVEPYHRARNLQHTETDLILRGNRTLVMAEMKLGPQETQPNGWRQSRDSPLVDDYEPWVRPLLKDPARWQDTMERFAQLYKNLILGQRVAELWAPSGTPLELHLLTVVNGNAGRRLRGGSVSTYRTEFDDFRATSSLPASRLHLLEWQEIRRWISRIPRPELEFALDRLTRQILLKPAPFRRIIAVDWSGAKDPATQKQKIWWCNGSVDQQGELRIGALSHGNTRAEFVDWLKDQTKGPRRMLVGLDFPFSFPKGWVGRQQLQETESWDDVVAFCRENAEAILGECLPPFWGHPGTTKPRAEDFEALGLDSLFRKTEARTLTAKSAFQIGGAGAPGTAAVRGIPHLLVLRQAGFSIWPFDGSLEELGLDHVVVEIYPRVFEGDVRKSNREAREELVDRVSEQEGVIVRDAIRQKAFSTEDAFDAFISAVAMWKKVKTEGAGFDRYGASFHQDQVIRSEGWIWGVPYIQDGEI